jgi:hypothetical protein
MSTTEDQSIQTRTLLTINVTACTPSNEQGETRNIHPPQATTRKNTTTTETNNKPSASHTNKRTAASQRNTRHNYGPLGSHTKQQQQTTTTNQQLPTPATTPCMAPSHTFTVVQSAGRSFTTYALVNVRWTSGALDTHRR